MASSFNWFSKETHKGTPVGIKMENPNWSMVEISSKEFDDDVASGNISGKKGDRNKTKKQITWVLLLKAHRAAGCLTSIASAAFAVGAAIRRPVLSGRTDSEPEPLMSEPEESPAFRSRFYTFIKMFLWLSVILLGFEILHLRKPFCLVI